MARRTSPIRKDLIDSQVGETCVILGCGPSLLDYDLTLPFFREQVTFGANAIGRAFAPTYYVLTDHIAWDTQAYLVDERSHLILGAWLPRLPKNPSLVYYSWNDKIGPPTKGRIFHGRTSGIVMMHMAYQMGFKRYFLLGIDGKQEGNMHFYPDNEVPAAPLPASLDNADEIVSEMLGLFRETIEADGGEVWQLSRRAVYDQIPLWDRPLLA